MTIQNLFSFIDNSPTAFHAVNTVEARLQENGYTKLFETESAPIELGGKYYFTRNSSSVIAFQISNTLPVGFMIAASHSDSPTFKIKPNGELEAIGQYLKLNTERYGGMIMSSWFDRPLSIAGRVIIETEDGIEIKLVNIDRDLLVIPNVAIHMNRTANDGYKYNPASDTLPLMASLPSEDRLIDLLAEAAECPKETIIGHDLFLYARQKSCLIGSDDSFFLAPRIDNLECAHATLEGFLKADVKKAVALYAVFDNEETGSSTKQGAASDFLQTVITRITASLGIESPATLLANSMMLSADNAHARHPNHPELSDAQNAPHMNKGIVIKYNASQKYTTDGISASLFTKFCQKAEVPVQIYANRSDMAGGSTLGSIATTKVSIKTVDIGLAQLAMHSACETAGTKDIAYLEKASEVFFSSSLITDDHSIKIEF